jgi:DedD protein
MEEGAKRRLVGAAVIVALMVIFVPMLVEEEEGESPIPDSALEVPPRPAFEPEPTRHPTAELQPDEVVAEPPDAPAELQPPPLYIPPETDVGPIAEEDVWTPAPVMVPDPEPAPEPETVVTPATPAAPPPVAVRPEPPAAQPARPAAPTGPSSWVVQVAALSEQPRAQALEQQLQDQGFPAFIESVRIDGRLFHRVRIGPEPDKGRAEGLAATLRDQGHAAQVHRYP